MDDRDPKNRRRLDQRARQSNRLPTRNAASLVGGKDSLTHRQLGWCPTDVCEDLITESSHARKNSFGERLHKNTAIAVAKTSADSASAD